MSPSKREGSNKPLPKLKVKPIKDVDAELKKLLVQGELAQDTRTIIPVNQTKSGPKLQIRRNKGGRSYLYTDRPRCINLQHNFQWEWDELSVVRRNTIFAVALLMAIRKNPASIKRRAG